MSWGWTSDWAWFNILDFLFQCWRCFSKNALVWYILRIKSCKIYFTLQWIVQCAHKSIQMCNIILVKIWIVTARPVSENAVRGRLWYGIIFLNTKERNVMILIAMNCKPIHNFKYTTQKSDILRNQIHLCNLAAKNTIRHRQCLLFIVLNHIFMKKNMLWDTCNS